MGSSNKQICLMEASMASDQPLLSQQEIMRRQSILDACWEQKLIEKEYRREVVGAAGI
jgi:hypothetical protein